MRMREFILEDVHSEFTKKLESCKSLNFIIYNIHTTKNMTRVPIKT